MQRIVLVEGKEYVNKKGEKRHYQNFYVEVAKEDGNYYRIPIQPNMNVDGAYIRLLDIAVKVKK